MTQYQTTQPAPDGASCIACGYQLTGVDPEGGCPECGRSVAETLEARRVLTRRQLASVLLRVLGLWLLFESLSAVLTVAYLIYMYFSPQTAGMISRDIMVWQLITPTAYLICGVLLFALASRVAALMVKIDGRVFAVDAPDVRVWFSAALILLGVWQAFQAAVGIVESATFDVAWDLYVYDGSDFYQSMLGNVVRLILAVLLIAVPGVRNLLARGLPSINQATGTRRPGG